MHSTIVKKVLLFLCLLIVMSLACDLSVSIAPPASPTSLPVNTFVAATEAPTLIAVSPAVNESTLAPNPTATMPPSFEGVEVTVDPLTIVLPSGLASGERGLQFPRAEGEEIAPWEVTPGHIQLKLEGYLLQGKFHEPQIYVYPALEYAVMYPPAFESIHRLDNILYTPGGPSLEADQLPVVPFFNAAQIFTSNAQVISFQNGQGVRFLTEYAQSAASVNNHDLFYHFEGVTRDGEYYIVAILPITAPVLAETSDAAAPLPPGGVPYPYLADPNADMQAYYASITDVLNATPPQSFTPTIGQLDALIQSMRIP